MTKTKKKYYKKIILSTIIIFVFILIPLHLTYSQKVQEEVELPAPKVRVEIPGLDAWDSIKFTPGQTYVTNWIVDYLVAIYNYGIIFGGIVATLILMIGGLLYVLAGANPSGIQKAKSMISGALIGLVILMCTNIILNTINPNLVNLKTTLIESVSDGVINESEFANTPVTNTPTGTGKVVYYAQTDIQWACYPLTGNNCSYQNGKVEVPGLGKYAVACGTAGYKMEMPGISNPPQFGIFSCKFKNDKYPKTDVNYCEWLEKTYKVSELCNNPNVKDSAWCSKNPWGANNFVEFCKNSKMTNSTGGTPNTNVIQSSGCGLTSSAMVLNYYGISVTPPDVAKWIQLNGIRAPAGSVSGSKAQTCCGFDDKGMAELATANGLKSESVWNRPKDDPKLIELLSKGIPVIIRSIGRDHPKCKFTKNGHYIVLTSYSGGVYGINDPVHRGLKTASAQDIWDDCGIADSTYFYKPGEYGIAANLTTADDSAYNPPNFDPSTGECPEADASKFPDYSKFNSGTGCYNSLLKCTSTDIKNVGTAWANAKDFLTAPNSCAKISSRILKNSGCKLPGATCIGALGPQLTDLRWKALIVGGGAASKYPSLLPAGAMFRCNGGTLQHVFISLGEGKIVESNTGWSSECAATGCPKANKDTYKQNDLMSKCVSNGNGTIENLNPISSNAGSTNQCVHGGGSGTVANIVFFPEDNLDAGESGCCKSDLIAYSLGLTNPENGIKTSPETCVNLKGTFTPGGTCEKALTPSEAITGVVDLKQCGAGTSNWYKTNKGYIAK